EPNYHCNLGVALQNQGQIDEAIRSYREAIRRKPDFVAAHSHLAQLLATSPDLRFRDPKLALIHADKASALAPIRPLGPLVSAGVGGLDSPYAMIFGPDGHLYVSGQKSNNVFRYDASTGRPLPASGKTGAEFVTPGSGGLKEARDIAF